MDTQSALRPHAGASVFPGNPRRTEEAEKTIVQHIYYACVGLESISSLESNANLLFAITADVKRLHVVVT